ncbi:TetR/AcrR family transcriptional regulator [Leucobacter chromiireducens]|uniref:TetR/AcrR family transcriptional regulator n=1 Tax=Leucobacter chromiireducens TaxID=283877 RepID=UPI003F80A9BE
MPKIVDHDERRAEIVQAVTRIIIRDGFDRVTMRGIAAEIGYAHGALARYFPDKKSLLTAAYLQVFNTSHAETLRRVGSIRGLDALREMSHVLLPFAGIGAEKSRVVLSFWDRAAQDEALREIHTEAIVRRRGLIRRFLTEAAEDGELRADLDLEIAIEEVSARNAGWQMLAVLVPDAASDEKLSASLEALINSFRPCEARA